MILDTLTLPRPLYIPLGISQRLPLRLILYCYLYKTIINKINLKESKGISRGIFMFFIKLFKFKGGNYLCLI